MEHQTVSNFLSSSNMKFLFVFVALFAMALARPNDVVVLKSDSDVGPDTWSSDVETSDGTSISQKGVLKNAGTEHEAAVVHGSFSWVDEKTGEKFTINYVADENGYQPVGAHLPVAPVA
ncbi:larval cuticle protein 65Ab1 [Drosophila yakuba]|nr:larval cuticle protein 65Ab1 [Drosophila yakuba]